MTGPIGIRMAIAPGLDKALESAVSTAGAQVTSIDDATGLIWTRPSGAEDLASLIAGRESLRWIQLPWSGVEEFVQAGLCGSGHIWTSAKGVYSWPVAEHALAMALALLHDIPRFSQATKWLGHYRHALNGKRVAIVGGGGIGRSLAEMHSVFNNEITAVTRDGSDPGWGDRAVAFNQVLEAVARCDLVYLALPLTPETRGLGDRGFFEALGSDGYLVNVARGAHVVTEDLLAALGDGGIAGAALDVTDPEPLPDNHVLWTMERCLITPHTAVPEVLAEHLLRDRITENIRRFASGDRLLGVIDPTKGY